MTYLLLFALADSWTALQAGAAAVALLLQSPAPSPSAPVSSNPGSQLVEIAKLLAVAIPGYLVARLQAKKEQKTAEAPQHDENLVASWQTMSMQARDHLTQVYGDLAREREAKHAAEARVVELERELEELRRKGRG